LIDAALHAEQLAHGLVSGGHAVEIAHFGKFSGSVRLHGERAVLILFSSWDQGVRNEKSALPSYRPNFDTDRAHTIGDVPVKGEMLWLRCDACRHTR
jgi:hypothetical protein